MLFINVYNSIYTIINNQEKSKQNDVVLLKSYLVLPSDLKRYQWDIKPKFKGSIGEKQNHFT